MIEIDEIISNAEYCADVYERMNNAIHPALQVSDYKRHAEDHRQLAEWLKDYKKLKEQEPSEDWHDTPSGEMTLEQARQAVRELRKYVMDKIEPCKMREAIQKERERIEQYIDSIAEPCEDCINRQAVLDIVDGYSESQSNVEDVTQDIISDIAALPPVTQQPKIGHWIDKDIRGSIEPYCSVCGDSVDTMYHYDYCPNCGAMMVEQQKRESEETR